MRKEYIPVATSDTVYYKPQTEAEFNALIETMKIGDMIFSKWVFQASSYRQESRTPEGQVLRSKTTEAGIWYTMGLIDENSLDTKMLFPNILLGSELSKPLSRWGLARMEYLKNHNKFLAAQMGTAGLHKHCLEIEAQAKERKRNMMTAIRKDPANKVTEKDKAFDPISWARRMNNFQAMIHETIYNDLIYA